MNIRALFGRRYAPPGAAPGTMIIRPGAAKPSIRVMSYNTDGLDERAVDSVSEARAFVRDGFVTWIDVEGLGDEAVLKQIGEAFGLHPLALADVVNTGQRPKVEPYPEHLFIVTRMVYFANGRTEPRQEQVSVFLGRNYVLTFGEFEGDCLGPLRERIRAGKGAVRAAGPDYLACMILDAIVDGYFPLLESLGERLEDIERRVIGRPDSSALERLFRIKRELMGVRRAAWPQREMLSNLLRDEHPLFSDRVAPYLRDAYDHAAHIVDITEAYRELAQSLVDVYLSSVSNRTNEIMRVLTVITTIFIPLTFLVGIYGMNFNTDLPLNMPELNWRYGYVAFWVVTILIVSGLLLAFWRLGWLAPIRRSARAPRNARRPEAD